MKTETVPRGKAGSLASKKNMSLNEISLVGVPGPHLKKRNLRRKPEIGGAARNGG